MYAAHIIEPAHMGIPERHKVVLCNKRSERDKLVKYVNENAAGWREFRRKYPTDIVPTFYRWYMNTICEPITMKEAQSLIGNDDVMYHSDGYGDAYAYTVCDVYEFTILPYGERIGWKDGRHYSIYKNEEVAV